MAKLTNISGFPEWLPGEKIVENRIIAVIRSVYESYGFLPIETPAVELLSTLGSKGVIDKELYALRRVQASEDQEAELGLHFDLTVPFARYVAQHLSELQFPFKRYQVQKAWRGDRPQKGRFREFYQFDLDIVSREELPLSCDAEVLCAFTEALGQIGVGEVCVKINSRKLLRGIYESLGLSDAQARAALIVVDKIDKIGAEKVIAELISAASLDSVVAGRIVEFAKIRVAASDVASMLKGLEIKHPLFEQGAQEIQELLRLLPASVQKPIELDVSLVRGLDYYTGMIVEAALTKFPHVGSIGGGGRYENLASEFSAQKLPGVGLSIGLTRLLSVAFEAGLLQAAAPTTVNMLVTVLSEDQRSRANEVAAEFRAQGIPAEVYFKSPKLGKQIEYAEKKGIQFVAFVSDSGVEVKDIVNKNQKPLKEWLATNPVRSPGS